MSSRKTIYQTYVIRFPRRTDIDDAPYLLKDAGGKEYRSFTHLDTLLDILQRELASSNRENKKGLRFIFKDRMDGFNKYSKQWRAFWKRKAALASTETES